MSGDTLVDRLASHRALGHAPPAELEWIAAHGVLRTFAQGEVVSRHTVVVDGLYIVLSGRLSIYVSRGGGPKKMMEWRSGDVTGLLPYSRMQTPPGDTVVEEPAEVVVIDRDDLPELIRRCYVVTEALVHEMTDRARRFTSSDLRDEKMIALGKLAAGLAHELNNPASAAVRDATTLADSFTAAEGAFRELCAANLTPDQLSALDAARRVIETASASRQYTGFSLSEREDEFSGWLRMRGIEPELAEELARTPVTTEVLEGLARTLPPNALKLALRWIVSAWGCRFLVADIERAATRIHSLVASVRGFTHMGRARDVGPVQLAAGIADTAALLEGKARAKSVGIALDIPPDLPPMFGLSVEINQIWMNLIDNAIDAAPPSGHVTVSASRTGAGVTVSVVDNGPGIPPGIKGSIFDPFFTTKEVGEGTGLGLDTVRRIVGWHNGTIEVDSRPGRTEFRVTLPAIEQ